MESTINFIDSTKNQVKKTAESLDQVKKSVSRQKSERETLQKNIKVKK